MNTKYLSLLTIVAMILLGIALLSSPKKAVHTEGNLGKLFPDFAAKASEVVAVNVRSATGEFNLQRQDKQWVLVEKEAYPVQLEKVNALLLALGDLNKVEAATTKAELYNRIQVEDVSSKDAKSVQTTAKNASGQALLNLLVGSSKPAKGDNTRREIFVRGVDDKQSWRVLGALSVERVSLDWLDTLILDDNADDIQSVAIDNAGETVRFAKGKKGDNFELADLPVGATLKKEANLNLIAAIASNLNFEDVLKAAKVDFSVSPVKASFSRFDGVSTVMTVVKKEGKYYATLAASFSAPVKEAKAEVKPEEQKAEAEAHQKLQASVDAFNARTAGWAYVIPDYKLQRLEIKNADLYELKAAEETKEMANSLLNPAASPANPVDEVATPTTH